MSELDEFLRWIARRKDNHLPGYNAIAGAIQIFRAEKVTGSKVDRWVDAAEILERN